MTDREKLMEMFRRAGIELEIPPDVSAKFFAKRPYCVASRSFLISSGGDPAAIFLFDDADILVDVSVVPS